MSRIGSDSGRGLGWPSHIKRPSRLSEQKTNMLLCLSWKSPNDLRSLPSAQRSRRAQTGNPPAYVAAIAASAGDARRIVERDKASRDRQVRVAYNDFSRNRTHQEFIATVATS